jgi:phosphoribosylamine--glycine ligase
MGAYAPAPIVSDDVLRRVAREIVEPTLAGMRAEGNLYVGCLYVGVMIENGVPRVVEFNSRFGDPETQVVLPLIEGDFAALLHAAATGTLAAFGDVTSRGSAVCVVMASEGYPGSYPKGRRITGIADAESRPGVIVFHAGTRADGDHLLTSGGRVLGVTAVSGEEESLESTIRRAYDAVASIGFEGAFYRSDIGRKGVRGVDRG